MWTSSLGCLVRKDIAPKTWWKWFVQVVLSSCTTVKKSFSHHMSPSRLSMCLSSLKEFSFFIYPIRKAVLMESFERYLRSRWYYYSATGIGTYIYTSTGKTDLIEEEDDWISFVCVCVCVCLVVVPVVGSYYTYTTWHRVLFSVNRLCCRADEHMREGLGVVPATVKFCCTLPYWRFLGCSNSIERELERVVTNQPDGFGLNLFLRCVIGVIPIFLWWTYPITRLVIYWRLLENMSQPSHHVIY